MNIDKQLEEEMIALMDDANERSLQPLSVEDIKFVRSLKVEIRRLTKGAIYPDEHKLSTFCWEWDTDIEVKMAVVHLVARIARMYIRESFRKAEQGEVTISGLMRWQMGQLVADAYQLYLVLTSSTGREE